MHRESISYWQKDHSLPKFPSLKENRLVEVCIIGGGIAGVTAAYLLSKAGKSVILLDDGPIAGGQTIRTTGHLSNVLDDRFYQLQKTFGDEGAQLAAASHGEAIDFIEKMVKTHHIDCDFERLKAYLFTGSEKSTDELEKELKAAHQVGFKDAKIFERAPLKSFDTGSALCFPHQAQFSPLPYLKKLCELIVEQAGEIFCSTHAVEIKEKDGLFDITTDQEFSVSAKHLILATNTFTGKPMYPKQAQYRTYAIAAKIPHGSVTKALYYDTLDPYHYVRLAKYDEKFDMLIIGGEDHRTAEKAHVDFCYKHLEIWARERFPMIEKISHQWSGQIAEPIDGLGFAGRAKKDSEKYLITGHSGNGLTHGTLSAILIHDLILKQANEWEKLYDPNRTAFKHTGEFLAENLNSIWQYRDWVTPGEISNPKELKPNCGAILRKGLKKYACYKDEDGKTHQMSAKCPHLGAVVRWNKSEHCWECPAHGSRFSAEGKCLLGPANCDLKPK